MSLNGRIKEANYQVDTAEKNKELIVKDVQKKCKHEQVLHTDYTPGTFFSGMDPTRICLQCGLEESGWSFQVLNTEFVKTVDRREIWRNRI